MNDENVVSAAPYGTGDYVQFDDAGAVLGAGMDDGAPAVARSGFGALKESALGFLCGKRQTLAWFDILILSVIMWGDAIYTSTEYYIMMAAGEITLAESMGYSTSATDTYTTLYLQALYLFAALLYLWARGFDFRILNFNISLKAIAYGCLIFVGSAFLCDVCDYVLDIPFSALAIPEPILAMLAGTGTADVLYAAFNGFYEEFYFLGLCFSVSSRDFKWVLPLSILVRTSFHTYQGMVNALCIGVAFGLFMAILYYRDDSKNLFPYALGHGIADIFGLSMIQFFM